VPRSVGSIIFCTTGVLTRKLTSCAKRRANGGSVGLEDSGISVVFVDEVLEYPKYLASGNKIKYLTACKRRASGGSVGLEDSGVSVKTARKRCNSACNRAVFLFDEVLL
jgi:hypothetical protein